MKQIVKHLSRLVLVAVLALPFPAAARPRLWERPTPFATPGRIGLGLASGSFNNGISLKTYFTRQFAGAVTVGYWWGYGLSIVADAVWEQPPLVQNSKVSLNWYAGAGPLATVGQFGSFLGVDGFAGLGLQLKPFPLELTADVRPTVYFGSIDNFFFGGQGAIRYWF